jgi:ABC-2 type transport system ATP-binding protein
VTVPDTAIRAENLRARYGSRLALDSLSFVVGAGEVVGLLGPNGAGKTTTVSILATLRAPDGGTATVGGHSTARAAATVRGLVGYVPQSLAIYPTLTAAENVLFFARVLGLVGRSARDEATRVLDQVGLTERRDDVVATFSGGMQRRLNLACGLLRSPPVLLLDEPTVGVDPQSRERIASAVRGRAAAGAAVVYSTHDLNEAERICDRVLLIDHGNLIASGTPAALIREWSRGCRVSITTANALPGDWLRGVDGARIWSEGPIAGQDPPRGNTVQVRIETSAVASRVVEAAVRHGGEMLELHLHQPDLQDVFLQLTGRGLRD